MNLKSVGVQLNARWRAVRGAAEGHIPMRYLPQYCTHSSRVWTPESKKAYMDYLDVLAKRKCGAERAEAFLKEWHIGRASFAEAYNLYEQVYVKDQYHARDHMKPDAVVVDVGANLGFFARLAAELAPKGQVYAFEPVPSTFALLQKNAPQALSVIKGLGATTEKKKIFTSDISMDCSVLADSPHVGAKNDDYSNVEEVALTSLDEFVAERKLSRVDFIKIDIEGYERFALEGARATLTKWKPVVAVSAYHNPDDKTVLPALMASIDPSYRYTISTDGDEDFIFSVR
ncbi:MAG: FkbM family methyltransferase [Candidatus Liptonbacteria bacterium]|nr:FkbM family methyltransferase [Candidatus Liptonbacteria bacterium]